VYASLGCAYQWQGDYAKAIEYHTQSLSIAKELGDRAGSAECGAYANLGTAYDSQGAFSKAIGSQMNEYVKAVAYFEAQHSLAMSLKLAHMQSDASLNMGVAPSPVTSGQLARALLPSLTKSSWTAWACLNHPVREPAKWLQAGWWSSSSICKIAPVAPHLLCGPRGRGTGTSQRAPLVACATGT
jgi:tetratricopeptide (TPR) repeat protein